MRAYLHLASAPKLPAQSFSCLIASTASTAVQCCWKVSCYLGVSGSLLRVQTMGGDGGVCSSVLAAEGEPRFGPRAQPISRGLLSSPDIFLLLPSNPAAACVEPGDRLAAGMAEETFEGGDWGPRVPRGFSQELHPVLGGPAPGGSRWSFKAATGAAGSVPQGEGPFGAGMGTRRRGGASWLPPCFTSNSKGWATLPPPFVQVCSPSGLRTWLLSLVPWSAATCLAAISSPSSSW